MTARDARTLAALYALEGVPLDRLPYSIHMTNVMNSINQRARRAGRPRLKPRDVWLALLAMRKAGRLPTLTDRRPRKEAAR